MTPPEDIDGPPASDDPGVQAFLETHWREAMRAARDGMEALRRIHPEMMEHLPEGADRSIGSALSQISSSYRDLHAAGPRILGQEEYDEYLRALTRRSIGG